MPTLGIGAAVEDGAMQLTESATDDWKLRTRYGGRKPPPTTGDRGPMATVVGNGGLGGERTRRQRLELVGHECAGSMAMTGVPG
ncbi:hypothetical protein E2562_027845 [Oryza meyeriana var. granulata]|uniref:Uncharacterized protein n=1 Tax=Oryza meyeriana var. granulata TaxID=110450 RepID=A0A6G1DPB8_9ORYZ|nr:hypothetical protein E2562_027845 [Oryza meyeriana var. granulata]